MNAEIILRIGIAIVMLFFGIDQLLNYKKWRGYVPKWLNWAELPNETIFWRTHASLNIIISIMLITGKYLPYTAAFTTLWLASITFVTSFSDWQTSIRDLGLTFSALALTFLAG